MEVIIGENTGFCSGVNNAIKKVEQLLNREEKIYCLGRLIHDGIAIKNLKSHGLILIEDINDVPSGSTVVVRTYGVPKKIYEQAKKKQIQIFDLTCPKILEIHNLVSEYSNKGYYILLIGDQDNPENIATISFADKNRQILQDKQDIDIVLEEIKKSKASKLLIIAQSTFPVDIFNEYIEKIKLKINFNIKIEIIDTICNQIKLKQEETKKISKQSELMIIIGDKNSSNAKKLYDIAIRECNNAMHVETKEDLYMNYVSRFQKIGVIAGTTTSQERINEIINILKQENNN